MKVIILGMLVAGLCPGQSIENLVDEDSEQPGLQIIADQYEELEENPVNILSAGKKRLSEIPGITETCAEQIIKYRRQGKIRTINDLTRVPCIDEKLFQDIRTFTPLNNQTPPLRLWGRQRGVFVPGESGQLSDFKTYMRVKCHAGDNFFFGGLIEKDKHEKNPADLWLTNCHIKLPQHRAFLLLGHFRISWGQGLFLWGGFRSGSLFSIHGTGQKYAKVRPFLSVAENSALNGICFSKQMRRCELQAFYSRTHLDASSESDAIMTLKTSGIHRTMNERESKDFLQETLYGLILGLPVTKKHTVGLAYQKVVYSLPFARRKSLDKAFYFSGKNNNIASLTFRGTFGLLHYYGEAATSLSGGTAATGGLYIGQKNSKLLLSARIYRTFQNLRANGFGENNLANNETGYLLGWSKRMQGGTSFFFAMDVFRHPWAEYLTPMPTSGWTFCSRVQHRMGRMELQCRIKIKTSEAGKNFKDKFGNSVRYIAGRHKLCLRLQLDYRSKKIRARTRAEWIWARQDQCPAGKNPGYDSGAVVYHDLRKNINDGFFIHGRYSLFFAPEYDTRFFLYENDVPGTMKLKMLYGQGTRWFFLFGLKRKIISLHAKYSSTLYFEFDKFGRPAANGDRLMSFQLDWRL